MKKLFALMLVMSSSLAFGVTTVTFDDGTVVELAQNENLFVSTDSLYSLTKITAGNGEISYKFAPVTPVTKGEEVSETVEESDNDTTPQTDNSGFTVDSFTGTGHWSNCAKYDPDNTSNLATVQEAWSEGCDKNDDGKYELCDDYTPHLYGYTFSDTYYYRACVYNQDG